MKTKVTHYPNGNIASIEIRNDSGALHNTSNPACQGWYENGQEAYRYYYVDGKLHNTSGPAHQGWHENGQEAYRAHCVDGKLHNPSGPARQGWHGNGREVYQVHYVDGKLLSKEEFQELQNTVEVTANGKTVRISKTSAKSLNLL